MSPRLLLLVALAAACSFFNPAYDDGGSDDAATATTSDGMTADASSTSSSSSATSMEPTTTATSAATTDTTTTQGTSESEGTTEAADGCWGSDLHAWEVTVIPGLDGLDERSPRLAADGLSLLFSLAGAPTTIYRASRPDRESDFTPDKTPVADFGGVHGLDYINLRGDELIFALTEVDGVVPQIAHSTHDGRAWSKPVAYPPMINPRGIWTDSPSLSEDGARMVYVVKDGDFNQVISDTTLRLHEATRPVDPPPAAGFSSTAPVAFAEIPDPSAVATLCPVVSPDGLHLFFGSTYPHTIDPINLSEALSVLHVDRATVNDPWSSITELPELDDDDPMVPFNTCPVSVTRDGCELTLVRFQFPEGLYRTALARRSP